MSEADKEIDIEELKEALKLWIKKWKQEREICKEKQCKEEEIKLTSLIYLAQWIINSKKGYAVDITKILREGVLYMSNKTSDKNVANVEDDVKYVKEMLEIARIFFKAVKAETDYKNVDEIAFCNAIENILAEREQKDKRIQELEADLYSANEIISDLIDNIPKQVVIDKIKEYDKKMKEDAGHPNWVVTDRIVMNVLQELLEGERK